MLLLSFDISHIEFGRKFQKLRVHFDARRDIWAFHDADHEKSNNFVCVALVNWRQPTINKFNTIPRAVWAHIFGFGPCFHASSPHETTKKMPYDGNYKQSRKASEGQP
jgi:hypothetical protein